MTSKRIRGLHQNLTLGQSHSEDHVTLLQDRILDKVTPNRTLGHMSLVLTKNYEISFGREVNSGVQLKAQISCNHNVVMDTISTTLSFERKRTGCLVFIAIIYTPPAAADV